MNWAALPAIPARSLADGVDQCHALARPALRRRAECDEAMRRIAAVADRPVVIAAAHQHRAVIAAAEHDADVMRHDADHAGGWTCGVAAVARPVARRIE